MKNTVVAITICLFPCAVWAQSTCETRVDAHQQATTTQRVAYCLMPDSQASAHNPGLVFSGVSSPRPEVSHKPEKATSKGGDFKADRMAVSKEFVETNRFPKVSDGRVSQQEVLQKQAALQEGKQMAQTAVEQSKCVLSEEPVQTIAGTRARRTKPSRQMKKTQKSATATKNTKPKKTMATTNDLETASVSDPMPSTPLAHPEGEPAAVPQTDLDAPADEGYEIMNAEEIPVGTVSYAPAK